MQNFLCCLGEPALLARAGLIKTVLHFNTCFKQVILMSQTQVFTHAVYGDTHTHIYIHAPLHRCAHRNRFSSSPITKRILITCCLKSEACILHTSVRTNTHHLWNRAKRNNSVSRDYFCPVIQPVQNNELSRGLEVTKGNEIQLQKEHDEHF